MLKNITLGQDLPGDTAIHNMDPRTKIILALVLLITIFIVKTFWAFIILTAFIAIVIFISKVGALTVLRGIKPLMFILIFTFVLNIFFYQGDIELKPWDIVHVESNTVLFEAGIIKISTGGIIKAVFIAIRLILLIVTTSVLTLTTSPMQLTDGMESLLGPLKKLKAPVHEMAMMMSIALRFIPTLIDETDRIRKAQTARGAEFDSGNIFEKAKNMVPLLVPLFVSAFKRADELATAMEARCYRGGEGRTRMKELQMAKVDAAAFFVCIPLCAVLILFF